VSYASALPVPRGKPLADVRTCPYCKRSIEGLRRGLGHKYPCPCIDIERVSAPAWRQGLTPSPGAAGTDAGGTGRPSGADTPYPPSEQDRDAAALRELMAPVIPSRYLSPEEFARWEMGQEW